MNNLRAVNICGRIYPSVAEAAQDRGLTEKQITSRCKWRGRYPYWFFTDDALAASGAAKCNVALRNQHYPYIVNGMGFITRTAAAKAFNISEDEVSIRCTTASKYYLDWIRTRYIYMREHNFDWDFTITKRPVTIGQVVYDNIIAAMADLDADASEIWARCVSQRHEWHNYRFNHTVSADRGGAALTNNLETKAQGAKHMFEYMINGRPYATKACVAKAFAISEPSVAQRCSLNATHFSEWSKWSDCIWLTKPELWMMHLNNCPLHIDGVPYPSIAAAVTNGNVSAEEIYTRCMSDYPEWKEWAFDNTLEFDLEAEKARREKAVSLSNGMHSPETEPVITEPQPRLSAPLTDPEYVIEGHAYADADAVFKVFNITRMQLAQRCASSSNYKDWLRFDALQSPSNDSMIIHLTARPLYIGDVGYDSVQQALDSGDLPETVGRDAVIARCCSEDVTWAGWRFVNTYQYDASMFVNTRNKPEVKVVRTDNVKQTEGRGSLVSPGQPAKTPDEINQMSAAMGTGTKLPTWLKGPTHGVKDMSMDVDMAALFRELSPESIQKLFPVMSQYLEDGHDVLPGITQVFFRMQLSDRMFQLNVIESTLRTQTTDPLRVSNTMQLVRTLAKRYRDLPQIHLSGTDRASLSWHTPDGIVAYHTWMGGAILHYTPLVMMAAPVFYEPFTSLTETYHALDKYLVQL